MGGYAERPTAGVFHSSFVSEREKGERCERRNRRKNRHKEEKKENAVNRNEIAGK